MVESAPLPIDLEDLSEAELEHLISTQSSDEARLVLGTLLLEGSSSKIKKNETKGMNWIKEAIKNNHVGALEYKAYHDIRFDKQPKLKKIQAALEKAIEKKKSPRALNTLAEFYYAQDKLANSKEMSAKYYSMSGDQGCQLGTHWMGVFYHMGFGVGKNVEKAIEFLTRAAKSGNGQSYYQLYVIFSTEEGFKDAKKAYQYLERAIMTGVTMFDALHLLFQENFDELAPVFIATKKPSALVDKDNKTEVINMHEAYVKEMTTTFSQALNKDRLYLRPAGFLQDNQIWMMGVLSKYFVNQVLRFSHTDFIKAIKLDLGPMLGEMGIWVLTNYSNKQQEKGKTEKKKMTQVAIEIVKSYLEKGLDYLGKENKYHFINKFSPKKCPAQLIKRSSIQYIYAWNHYAPQTWFEHLQKAEAEQKAAESKTSADVKKCSFCGSPEAGTRKHKVCSACKQAFYCSTDCQKYDWSKTHKAECKKLQAAGK